MSTAELERSYEDIRIASVERKARKAKARAAEHRRRWMFQHVPQIAAAFLSGHGMDSERAIMHAMNLAATLYDKIQENEGSE